MSTKKAVITAHAPDFGAFSQAIEFGGLLFTSGNIAMGIEDKSLDPIPSMSIAHETDMVMGYLGEVVGASGRDLNDVLKVTIYLTDLVYFAEFNPDYSIE